MTEFASRMERARSSLGSKGVDALCLSVGSDLPYLIGYRAMPLERLTMLVVRADGEAVLVVPGLEAPRVDTTDGTFDVRPWSETEDPIAIVADLLVGAARVAIGDETWSRFVLALQDVDVDRTWVPAGGIMRTLRIVKSPAEIAALRAAARTVDGVVDQMSTVQFSGRSELDVSREFVERTLADGHDEILFAIVASGPNGASPHHEPTDRIMVPGDAVVVDFGGHQAGYSSDTTRMFVVGDAPYGFLEAYEVLRTAQSAATAHVRPGVTASSIDAVAREIITAGGYGDLFIHRVGHGIGMDTHEHPYLVEGNDELIETGMAFSIEPGIYAPGEWGMRLEDIVTVTDTGVDSLNRSDRSFRIVS